MPTPAMVAVVLDAPRITWDFLHRFNGSLAAPLPASLPGDVGTLTVQDTNSVMSQAGGRLVVNGTVASNDRVITPATLARKAGRAMLWSLPVRTTGGNNIRQGLDAAAGAALDIGFDVSSSTAIRIKTVTAVIDTLTVGSGNWHAAAIMRGTGGFLLVRNGASGPYTLHWVYNTGTAALLAKLWNAAAAMVYEVGYFGSTDLSLLDSRWGSDTGIATQVLAGNRSALDAFTHTANALIEFTVTTLPTLATVDVWIRTQDATNTWIVRVDTLGNLTLVETVAGVDTERGSSLTAVAAGNRVVVVPDGSTIKVYVENVLKITYASATNFATATNGSLAILGTTAVVANIVTWPRTISLPARLERELLVA